MAQHKNEGRGRRAKARIFIIIFFRIHNATGLSLPLLLPEAGHHTSLQLQLEPPRHSSGQCSPSSAHAHTSQCGRLCPCVNYSVHTNDVFLFLPLPSMLSLTVTRSSFAVSMSYSSTRSHITSQAPPP